MKKLILSLASVLAVITLLAVRPEPSATLYPWEMEYRNTSGEGRLMASEVVGQLDASTTLEKRTMYTKDGIPREERFINDHQAGLRLRIHDGTRVVTAFKIPAGASPGMSYPGGLRPSGMDPNRDCVVGIGGRRDNRLQVLDHGTLLGRGVAIVEYPAGQNGMRIKEWRSLENCLPLRGDVMTSDGSLVSRKEALAIRQNASAVLYRVPESYEKVDPVEYYRRGQIFEGVEESVAAARAQQLANRGLNSDMAGYAPGFSIPEKLRGGCCSPR